MSTENPVLFYFWDHGNWRELRTDVFGSLVARAEVVFCEHLRSDLSQIAYDEEAYNRFIQTGKGKNYLPDLSPSGKEKYIAELMKGKNKRLVLEQTKLFPFDYNTLRGEAIASFFQFPWVGNAIDVYTAFRETVYPYEVKRTEGIEQQLSNIPEITVVVIGSGHKDLEKRISSYRKTEAHFPYKNYPISHEVLLNDYFLEKGKIEEEFYLKAMIENVIGGTLATDQKIPKNQERILSHEYAKLLTGEQILRYKESLVSGLKWEVSEVVLFESFLREEKIPLPLELLEEIPTTLWI